MIIAALIIGFLTAYYFGLKAGGAAAGAALGLFFLAALAPGATVIIYVLVGSGVGAVCFIGPRMPPPEDANKLRRAGRQLLTRLWRFL